MEIFSMKKLFATTFVAAASLALAACGSSTDASEDAVADTVEMPADEAMAGTPQPAEDPAALTESADSAESAAEDAAATAESMVASDAPAAPPSPAAEAE
jgi:hypothetical protein